MSEPKRVFLVINKEDIPIGSYAVMFTEKGAQGMADKLTEDGEEYKVVEIPVGQSEVWT